MTPDRFWDWVNLEGDCWLWRGGLSHSGYGRLRFAGRRQTAHRVAYELAVGPVPKNCSVRHSCGHSHCVRPAHLELVRDRNKLTPKQRHFIQTSRIPHRTIARRFGISHVTVIQMRRRYLLHYGLGASLPRLDYA